MLLNKNQIEQIKFLMRCVSKDEMRMVLNGVFAHSYDELIATNGVILCKLNINHGLEVGKIHKIDIKNKELISCEQISGIYPNWQNVKNANHMNIQKIGTINFIKNLNYLPITKMLKVVNFNFEILNKIPAGKYDFFVDSKKLNNPFLLQNDTIQITIMPYKILDSCYLYDDIDNIASDFKDYVSKIFDV